MARRGFGWGRWIVGMGLVLALCLGRGPGARAGEELGALVAEGAEASLNLPQGFETRVTSRFRIHSAPEDRSSAELLAAEIDGWYEQAVGRVGHPAPGPIDLLLAPTADAFLALQPRPVPAWAVGTAWAELGLIIVKSPRAVGPETSYSLRQTTVHEIAHILIDAAFEGRRVHRWLHEGLAKYVAGETTWETRIHLSRAVLTGSLIPLAELSRDFPRSSAGANLAYAQSLEFLDYLIDEYGTDVIPQLIDRMADGEAFEEAITTVTGLPLGQLEEEWHDHLRVNFAWLPALTTGGGLWVIASALLFIGWWRKGRESRERRGRWAVEEALVYGQPMMPAEPGFGALDGRARPRHLQVIDGGRADDPPAERPILADGDPPAAEAPEEEDDGLPFLVAYRDDDLDDDERPPPGGWVH